MNFILEILKLQGRNLVILYPERNHDLLYAIEMGTTEVPPE
jgi:hypothetical protein